MKSLLLLTVLSTTSLFSQWQSQTSNTSEVLLGVSFPAGDTGYVAGTNGLILATTNGGSNWASQASGTNKFLRDVFFTSSDSGIIVGESGLILQTTDFGATWTPRVSGTSEHLVHVHFRNQIGMASGQNGALLRTTDGGSSWDVLTSGVSVELPGLSVIDDTTACAVGFSGTILKTTNAGTTWYSVTSPVSSDLRSVFFSDNDNGYAVGLGGTILRTSNRGSTWSVQSSGVANNLYAVTCTDANFCTAVGTNIVLRTTNAGATWVSQSTGFAGDLYSVDFTDRSTGWSVGQQGKIFHTSALLGPTFTKITSGNPIATDAGSPANSYTGASWIDYDNDGKIDLFVSRGVLYHNDGGGLFTRLPAAITAQGNAIGNTWADYDDDGDLDCFISGGNSSGSILYRDDGNGVFTKITTGDIGNSTGNKGWACAWGDYDNDGYADLVIAAAVGFNGITTPNRLFHNNHDGTFTRIDTGAAVSATAPYTIPSWSDFDNDGDLDLFFGAGPATGITQPDYLYKNMLKETGHAFFTRITTGVVATDSRDGQIFNWIDYDNDADLDVYITNYGGGVLPGLANDLYRNDGGTFTKITTGAIVTDVAHSLASVWEDFDNDGDLDCFVTNDASQLNAYYQNNGDGTFTTVTTGALVTSAGPHYGATAGDYDNDGDIDLFVAGTTASKGLFRNDLVNGNSWMECTFRGTSSNRAAIGTKVRIKATINALPVWQMREISAQNSFGGQNSLVVHFGLGDATNIDSMRVEWPSGISETFANLVPGQMLTIVEADSTPVTLLSPTDGAVNNLPSVILRWNRSGYGAPYHLQVATDSTFASGIILNDSTITDTTASVTVLSNSSVYYWRVQSTRTIHKGVWSIIRHFTNLVAPPLPPVLFTPSNGAANQPIALALRWHPSLVTASYHLQFSADSSFASPTINDSTLTDTSKQVSSLVNLTKYYWRVRGSNIGGSSSFSIASFTTIIDTPAVPILISPANDSTNLPSTLTLSWNPALFAASYRLEVSKESTFATTAVVSVDSTTSRQVGPLSSLTKYFWRVRSSNVGGTSAYSPVRNFTTIIGAPVLLTPPNGSSHSPTLSLRWSSISGATMYAIEVATDSLLTNLIVNEQSLTDTLVSLDSLTDGTTYYWQVRAKSFASTSEWSVRWHFTVNLATVSSVVRERWNLVSVPLNVANASRVSLFPTSASYAYDYDSASGYSRRDTLAVGRGYWLRFSASQTVSMTGYEVDPETISVISGWNLVGSLSLPVSMSAITTSPTGIIESPFYGFKDQYEATDTLQPAGGYWVKATQAGKLIFRHAEGEALEKQTSIIPALCKNALSKLNTLHVQDAGGQKITLYFGGSGQGTTVDCWRLPPVPPDGVFDVRFATGTLAEISEAGTRKEIALQISSAKYPISVSWDIQDMSAAVLVLDRHKVTLQEKGSVNVNDPSVQVKLAFSKDDPSKVIPTGFLLYQNYPNPFNPTTQIAYDLPEPGNVRISIYDLLGRQVQTLLNEHVDAGHHVITWDATSGGMLPVVSGMYFYRFDAYGTAGEFHDIKKLTVVR